MFRMTIGVSVIAFASVVAACSSSDPEPAAGSNGVDDVKKACEIRVGWKAAGSSRCAYCLAAAANPVCACSEPHDFAGKCETQQGRRSKEPSCEGVEECRFKCDSSDCACVDACYAQKDACRSAAAALDGCVAEACTAECNAQ